MEIMKHTRNLRMYLRMYEEFVRAEMLRNMQKYTRCLKQSRYSLRYLADERNL